jgi:hypothetical protein
MTVESSQASSGSQPPGSEGRRFSTLIGSLAAAPADQQAATVRPTFTPAAGGPAVAAAPPSADTPSADTPSADSVGAAGAPATAPTRSSGPGAGTDALPVPPSAPTPPSPGTTGAPGAPAVPDTEGTRALPRPVPAAAMDEPLLGDVAALRSRWQRVQAGFVDDPQEAVGNAADLIEQTAQALVGALRQRQRQLRVMWERGPADDSAPEDSESAARAADTEHLRLLMQRYRALFNQLCRP